MTDVAAAARQLRGDADAPPGLALRRLADIPRVELRPVWGGRLLAGKVAILGGPVGVGKSYLSAAVAAACSRGTALPDGPPLPPGDALIASYEDDPGDTLRPRLDQLGADLTRVHVIDGVRDTDGTIRPYGPDDVPHLAAALDRLDTPRLLAIDPVGAWVGAAVDDHRATEVRAALEPLRLLAAARGLVVLLVMHLRKSGADTAINRLLGSAAYGQTVRSVLIAGRDPDDDTRCAVAHAKANVTGRCATVGYRVGADGLAWDGLRGDLDGERLVGHDSDDARGQQADAEGWLLAALAAGPQPVRDLRAAADAEGIAWRTAQRASRRLRVVTERDGFGRGAVHRWTLPITRSDTDASCAPMRATSAGGAHGAHGGAHDDHVTDSGVTGSDVDPEAAATPGGCPARFGGDHVITTEDGDTPLGGGGDDGDGSDGYGEATS